MNNNKEKSNLRAFAMEYGAFVGLVWIACFGCYIGEFTMPSLGTMVFVASVISIILGYKLVCRYLAMSVDAGDVPSGQPLGGLAFRFSMSMYMHAALIAAAGHFIYFKFIDHGYLFTAYKTYLADPEIHKMMIQIVNQKQIDDMLAMWQTISPASFTVELLIINIIIGVLLSLPTALFASMKKYGTANNNTIE